MFSEWPSGEPEQDNNLLLQEVGQTSCSFSAASTSRMFKAPGICRRAYLQ
jgi:hypothetical protein